MSSGFTVNDFIRKRQAVELKERSAAQEHFEPLVPNADTVEAMKAARRGDESRQAVEASAFARPRHGGAVSRSPETLEPRPDRQ